MSGRLRQPAVAGSFYPAQPDRLGSLVATLLAGAGRATRPDGLDPAAVAGLLVPHAGLVYSGTIAALSWALAGEIGPATIVLAGTDHQALARGVGVWTGGSWQTPLGDVPIDDDLAKAIAALGPPFAPDDAAHLGEHSLEVQLPLLARACPGARIVPMAVSPRLRSHAQAGTMLGRLLAERRTAGESILLVASSDLAHYPPARVCEATDAELLEPLLRMEADALRDAETSVLLERRPGLVCGLCGIDPVRVALTALAEMGATRGILLGAATSADAGGDARRTVGYAAAAFV
ncbi:MAG TPA: AmmeMemoRadiSam system protein B [Candidatus Limnocylindrales bacterium]